MKHSSERVRSVGRAKVAMVRELPGRGVSLTVPFASQMVFYIEACESGSMMNNLPSDINGRRWEPWPLSQAG